MYQFLSPFGPIRVPDVVYRTDSADAYWHDEMELGPWRSHDPAFLFSDPDGIVLAYQDQTRAELTFAICDPDPTNMLA